MSRCLFLLLKQNNLQHYIKSSNILLFRHYNKLSSTSDSVFLLRHQNTNLQCLRFNHSKEPKDMEDPYKLPWKKTIIAFALLYLNLEGLEYFYNNYLKGKRV